MDDMLNGAIALSICILIIVIRYIVFDVLNRDKNVDKKKKSKHHQNIFSNKQIDSFINKEHNGHKHFKRSKRRHL